MPTGVYPRPNGSWNRGSGSRFNAYGFRVRLCRKCGIEKPRSKHFWAPDKASYDGLGSGWCRSCITKRTKERQKECRTAAMIHYSGGTAECACCGENRWEFLCLDHIHGGGNKHRLELTGSKKGGASFYVSLKNQGFPEGFQVLCHNCNMAKHIYGKCPYEQSHVRPNTTRLGKVS